MKLHLDASIDTTVRGVDDASGQVLTGFTNPAEAAQSLAEGATDQEASVEEMQETINELTSGIKTTAEELGTAYDEAYKYAEKATTSLRGVVDGIQVIADSAKKIKEISIEQADSMEQVEATAERIAEVVQNNSAAAQETSATSEELTAQATTLSGMVSVFKLRQ